MYLTFLLRVKLPSAISEEAFKTIMNHLVHTWFPSLHVVQHWPKVGHPFLSHPSLLHASQIISSAIYSHTYRTVRWFPEMEHTPPPAEKTTRNADTVKHTSFVSQNEKAKTTELKIFHTTAFSGQREPCDSPGVLVYTWTLKPDLSVALKMSPKSVHMWILTSNKGNSVPWCQWSLNFIWCRFFMRRKQVSKRLRQPTLSANSWNSSPWLWMVNISPIEPLHSQVQQYQPCSFQEKKNFCMKCTCTVPESVQRKTAKTAKHKRSILGRISPLCSASRREVAVTVKHKCTKSIRSQQHFHIQTQANWQTIRGHP